MALYLCQVALLRIFYESLDRPFEPLLVAGIGSGEVAALTAAGGLSFEDALKVLAIRAEAIAGREGNTSLSEGFFTSLPRAALEEALSASGAELLAISSVISANAHGVSGEASAIAALASAIGTLTVAPQPLPSLEGSRLFASAQPAYASALEAVPFHKGLLKEVVSTTGDLVHRPEDMRASLVASLAHPVRYDLLLPVLRDQGITDIVSFGADLCLNTGAMASRMGDINIETMSDVLNAARGRAYG
jgi:[acyl-carrier-protein] S-malonyltransferase